MRNGPVPVSGENRRLRVGRHPGHSDLRQDAEAAERRERQLSDKVSSTIISIVTLLSRVFITLTSRSRGNERF